MLSFYVDDNILTGPSTEFNKHIQTAILKKFPGKALGQAEFFTVMKIERETWPRKQSSLFRPDTLMTL
jgi:hypothetical protein